MTEIQKQEILSTLDDVVGNAALLVAVLNAGREPSIHVDKFIDELLNAAQRLHQIIASAQA